MSGRRNWLPAAGCLLGWLTTRTVMAAVVHWSAYPSSHAVIGDTRLYASWALTLRSGHFPAADPSWQYPPGAAGVLVPPSLTAGYTGTFVSAMLATDLAVLLGLLHRARRGDGTAAAWAWVAGIAAVGPVALYRFDLVPTALAVAGLLAARPYVAGALLGLGGVVKLWPAVLVLSVRERGAVPVRAAAAALAVMGGLLAVLAGTGRLREALSFAAYSRDRGLQIESVAATPYLLAHAFAPGGGGLRVARRYGAYEVVGPYVGLGVTVTVLATVVVLAAYAVATLRARRQAGGDRTALAFAAVLLLVVTSKVLSPQYLVWAVGLGAVTLLGPGRRHRSPVVLLVVAAVLTQGIFPGSYLSLLHARPAAVLLLVARNGVLLAATVLAVRRALRTTAN